MKIQLAEAIEASDDTTDLSLTKLQEQKAKTKSERYKAQALIQLRYGIPVDAALVLKDDDGWHAQLRFTIT